MKRPRGSIVPDGNYFMRKTEIVAQDLLGHFMMRQIHGVRIGGRIVETEAYLFRDDPACHASRGETARNGVMFEGGGVAYVYLIYGMYHCLNFVCGPAGEGTAVLIRGIEPTVGIEHMRKLRKKCRRDYDLTNGPGKLSQALGIRREDNGTDLFKGNIRVYLDPEILKQKPKIKVSTRIGLNCGQDMKLRYYIKDNPFVSKR